MRRYAFPETLQTVLVDMYDFDRVNRALLLGYPLDFEIKRWRGSLADAPDLARYAQSTAAIRRELAPHLVRGTFRDRFDAHVEGPVEYGVHRAADGSLAIVLTNERDEPAAARVAAAGRPAAGRLLEPAKPARAYQAEHEVVVPPHGVSVVTL